MASQRRALLPAIVIICLDVSSIVTTAAAVVWNPKTSRLFFAPASGKLIQGQLVAITYVDSYNLDKGPVFYEAYYPDAHQEKRYFDRNTVMETSFQMPLERFAYSETVDHPVSINESLVVVDNKETETLPREQRKAIESRYDYDAASQLATFSDQHSTTFDDIANKNSQAANIEEISKLVRRAITYDLENWNALEGYLDRAVHQDRPMPQLGGMYSKVIHENRKGDSYMLPVNRRFVEMDSSKRSSLEASLLRKLDARNAKQRPIYFEGVDADGSKMTSEMSVSGTQAVDVPPLVDVISGSLPLENIFQPRPQLIRYTFFKRPVSPRLNGEQDERMIDQSTPRIYGDNLIREEIVGDNRDKLGGRGGRGGRENVKVTSIEISELPRHKTRHHHGEWPKRDYSTHRHRSQPAASSTVS